MTLRPTRCGVCGGVGLANSGPSCFGGAGNGWAFSTWGVVATMAVGAVFGLAAFTFDYGEGFSYFSKDPAACANCHIMQPQFDSWQKAGHHTVATCVDCHLPHAFIPKYIAKAQNGFFHSKGFTFQDFPEPIFIREENSRILHENCLACHGEVAHDMLPSATTSESAVSCVHCHRSAGHGDSVGLGKLEAHRIESERTKGAGS
jgi:cytochrome c nitrite reductase small subunit